MTSQEYLEKLRSVHGIGQATAEKISGQFTTEAKLVAAMESGDASDLLDQYPDMADAFGLEMVGSGGEPDAPADDAAAAPEAADPDVGGEAEPEVEEEAPTAPAPPTTSRVRQVRIQNTCNQVVKIGYHKAGKPAMARIIAFQTLVVSSEVLDSPSFEGYRKRGMVRQVG